MHYLCISARFKQAEAGLVLCNLVHLFLQISETQKHFVQLQLYNAIWVAASYKQEVLVIIINLWSFCFLLAQIVTLSCAQLKMQISFCAEAAASLAAAADALNLCASLIQHKEEDCRKINNLLK
jgi:hypothetical protein